MGNRTVVEDHTGVCTLIYTDRNQTRIYADAKSKLVSYTYDAVMLRRTMTNPDAGVTTYTHDLKRRLTEQQNPQGRTTTFTYDAADRKLGVALANQSRTRTPTG